MTCISCYPSIGIIISCLGNQNDRILILSPTANGAGAGMLEFRTQGFNGYGVKYSPFFDSRLAVASAANFGLVGNGRLYILGLTASGIVAETWYDTQLLPFPTLTFGALGVFCIQGLGAGVFLLMDPFILGSIRKTHCTICAGRKRTRIKWLLRREMARSSCSTSGSINFQSNRGMSTNEKCMRSTGILCPRTAFAPVRGMAVSK